MREGYHEDYFIELRHVQFEGLSEAGLTALEPWLPKGKGIFARLCGGHDEHDPFLRDYVLFTDDAVYFAEMDERDTGAQVLSLKVFKANDVVAYAFIPYPLPYDNLVGEPEIRLMLSHGRRIRLVFDKDSDMAALVPRFQDLVTKDFFRS